MEFAKSVIVGTVVSAVKYGSFKDSSDKDVLKASFSVKVNGSVHPVQAFRFQATQLKEAEEKGEGLKVGTEIAVDGRPQVHATFGYSIHADYLKY